MSTIHTTETLSSLSNTDLRTIYEAVVGRKPVAKTRDQIIAAILAGQVLTVADDVKASTEPGEQVAEAVAEVTNDSDDAPGNVVVLHQDAAADPDTEAVAEADSTTSDHQPQQVGPPTRVRVIGTGSNDGSILLCDLDSITATTATVKVMGQAVAFRTTDGEPSRVKKSWQGGGWRLDTSTLPPVPEPTVDDLARTPFKHLSVGDLQKVYQHLLGRETASTNRGYLTWVISEAKAGRVRSGGTRQRRGTGEKVKTLPLCLPESTVGALDAAWKRQGYPSRISFIRAALASLLAEKGEVETAGLFGLQVGE